MARTRRTTYKVVEVGRFDDSELKRVVFNNGNTVQDVLDKAGITLQNGEEVNNLNGTTQTLTKKVKNGDTLIVTGNVKSAR